MKSLVKQVKIFKAKIPCFIDWSFITVTKIFFAVYIFTLMTIGSTLTAFAQTDHIDFLIDGSIRGGRFDGIGAISAGASTRLLYDYPEPERSQILDYLFKLGYGASLQMLKIEIGGDMNSTDGSEASHMRTRDNCNCNLGYEWWLAKEARKRNPDIKLAALEWGAPGWFDGGFWSQDNIDYLLSWLQCAQKHGLKIDYVGGWNESGYNAAWYIKFRKALKKAYPDIELIAADQAGGNWNVATEMKNNPDFNAAVDIIGVHNPCGGRRNPSYKNCTVTEDALSLKKTMWASEFSSLAHNTGAIPIARALNRAYIDAKVTGQMTWSLVSAWYANFPIADTGPILAEWPWSGYYEVGKSIWSLAHTTQFTEPGWYYLDTGSRRLKSGATVVSLAAPSHDDYSTIIETTDMQAEAVIAFHLKNLPVKKLQVWTTDLESKNQSDYFRHAQTLTPKDGTFQLSLKPGYLYSISTVTDAGKGHDQPRVNITKQLSMPFQENFNDYQQGQLAHYFSDISGGFQTERCQAGRQGICYEQVVAVEPIPWHGADMPPTTTVGDPRWWGNYQVSADVLLEDKGYVELLGRIDGIGGDEFVSAYHLQMTDKGGWKFYSENVIGADTTLASGTTSFNAGKWHTLVLHFKGNEIQIFIDKTKIADIRDKRHRTGQVGFRVSGWDRAQFDNLQVTPTGSWPNFIPHSQMTATATSVHPGNVYGYVHPVLAAIDDRPESYWRSDWDPFASYPQSITLDLGKVHNVRGLTYQPQISGNWAEGIGGNPITNYIIYLSKNGKDFKKVTSGVWRNSMSTTKVVRWNQNYSARYIRLEATKGDQKGITVGEINVIQTGSLAGD